MIATWQNFCLVTPENPSGVRTLACVREEQDGWVWHARNSYTSVGELFCGKPGMTEKEAMAAAEEALREEYELLKGVFAP